MKRIYSRILTASAWILAVTLVIASASFVGPVALASNLLAVLLILLALRASPRAMAWLDRVVLRATPER